MISSKTIPCRACGAPLRFIKTDKGKTMPVDAKPIKFIPEVYGKEFFVTEDGLVIRGTRPSPSDIYDIHEGYVSHFATCPAAERFRKPRKSDRKAERDDG
jgi:hypothetical protein